MEETENGIPISNRKIDFATKLVITNGSVV